MQGLLEPGNLNLVLVSSLVTRQSPSMRRPQASVSKLRNLLLAPCIVPSGGGLGSRGAELYVKGMEEASNPQQWWRPVQWMGQHSAVLHQRLPMNSRLEVVSGYLVACLILYLCCHLALAQASPFLGLSPPDPPPHFFFFFCNERIY